ncbi:uncharacterized protein LOC134677238 [Cydia fagiglandana]|uniref:uncharacterized protein LOC134677238 n=1 Tax=Cydia fagiglandana TaxID=1458189 RepID=UPI002FEE4711
MFNDLFNLIVMARTTFLLLIIGGSVCFSMVTSLKQRHRNLRKNYPNPFHPEDDQLTKLMDFTSEDSDYFVERFGKLSEESGEGTIIIDKNLKVNGRHYSLRRSPMMLWNA